MKRILLTIFVFFFARTLLTSQTQPSYVFNNRVDVCDSVIDSGIKSISWNDGILIMGYNFDTPTHEGLSLSFYDTLGNILWKKSYYHPSYQYVQGDDIIAINNSTFYVAGSSYDTVNSWDPFFAKFDLNGDSIYFRFYPDTANNYFTDIELWGTDTFLLLGDWQANEDDAYNKYVLFQIDTIGNILNADSSTLGLKYPNQLLKTNSRIYVGGTRSTAPPPSYYVKVFIDVFDLSFNNTAYWNPSTTQNEYFGRFLFTNNKIYLTSRVTYYDPGMMLNFWQLRVGQINPSSGGYSFYTNVGVLDNSYLSRSFCTVNNNCLLFPFFTLNPNVDNELYFMDSLLNVICTTEVLYDSTLLDPPNFNELTILPNKKIVGTGYFYPQGGSDTQDHWNFMTENIENFVANNCVSIGIDENPETNKLVYKVFPNPFSTYSTIETNFEFENADMTIYNIYGQIVREFRGLSGNSIIFQRDNLSSGFYTIRMTQSNRLVLTSKIIITD